MIYNSADEVPAETQRELIQGLVVAGEKLREWREWGGFHQLRAQMLGADGPINIVCHHDDRITLGESAVLTDITGLVDRGGA